MTSNLERNVGFPHESLEVNALSAIKMVNVLILISCFYTCFSPSNRSACSASLARYTIFSRSGIFLPLLTRLKAKAKVSQGQGRGESWAGSRGERRPEKEKAELPLKLELGGRRLKRRDAQQTYLSLPNKQTASNFKFHGNNNMYNNNKKKI
jgi:hypothetical protein